MWCEGQDNQDTTCLPTGLLFGTAPALITMKKWSCAGSGSGSETLEMINKKYAMLAKLELCTEGVTEKVGYRVRDDAMLLFDNLVKSYPLAKF